MQTKEDFDDLLLRVASRPDLQYILDSAGHPPVWEGADTVYQSPYPDSDGLPRLIIWCQAEQYRVCLSGAGIYDLTATSIVCYPSFRASHETLIVDLLGSIMSWWLELRGFLTIHASAAAVKDQAIAFLSRNQGGKSVLAAGLMQAGYPLLTDDILAIKTYHDSFLGLPSYPQMRLWPDEAQYFLGHYKDLERVLSAYSKRRVRVGDGGFGSFCTAAQPLLCFYLPERRDSAEWGTKVEITPISSRDAIVELVRYSFSAHIVMAMGLAPQRLDSFARMVRQVPLRRLTYPSGFEHLPRVRDAILEDMERV